VNDWFVIRVTNNEATSIVAGPVSGQEAYAAFAQACTEETGDTIIVLPSNVTSDLLSRCGVLI
jgi:hypothetical protein